MVKEALKKNLSSMQVLKTLQVLLQGDYSMQDLIKILNKDEEEKFNNSVVSKYINTCRLIGVKIPKFNNKYYVAYLPFGIDLSLTDIENIKKLGTAVKANMTKKNGLIFDNFISKLNRFTKREISSVQKEDFIYSLEIFAKAVAQKRKINLIFKNKEELVCAPLNVRYENGKKYFYVYNKRVRAIDVNRLAGIGILDDEFVEPFDGEMVTVFKLKYPLAKRYEARSNESVEMNSDGTITVTNRNENKDLLLSRLMRYQEYCEILTPKPYREEFIAKIENALKNYGMK